MSETKYCLLAIRLVMSVAKVLLVTTKSLLRRTKESSFISDDKIALQAEYMCEKYIEQKLSQSGETKNLKSVRFKAMNSEGICPQEVVKTMQKYGAILENGFPKLYSNVTQQLNFRVNFDIVVCALFTCVCDNILASGITWAKIVSMYAFAAALAKDCCQANELRTAKSISRWMGQYTHKRLCGWIRQHGGWEGFAVHFDPCIFIFSSEKKCRRVKLLALSGFAMALFFATALVFKLK